MSLLPEGHRYSYSQLSSFSECPFGYYLNHIELQEGKSNGFAEQGTLIHDLLDKWAKKELTIEQLPKEYERRYPDEVVTSFPRMLASKGYAEKSYQQGLEYFENFRGFPGFEVIAAEEKFDMPLELTDGTTRPFIGFIDLVLRDEFTGGLVIMDHKSKSWATFRKERESMYRQQYLYAHFVHKKYNEWPQSLMFNLFKAEGKLDEQEFSLDKYNEVMQWATDAIHQIESYEILDWMECKEQKTPGKPDMYCAEICSVRGSCPNSIRRKENDYDYNGG
jgi:hypothetical protein